MTAGDEGQVTVGHSVGAAVVGQTGGGGHVVFGGHVGHLGSGSV